MQNPSPKSPITPGALIAGRYRLLRQVGEGAMGAVWAARNDATSGEVALKLLLRPDPELRQRLQREARAGALLKHRHILDVYDVGETDSGEPFLVMQLLSGETLADVLRQKRRLDPPMATLIGRDIARALSAAHAMRIVHRDLKPANVFLHQEPGEDEPVVKVLDFGVAKDLSSSDSLRTALGSVVGSLYYMSPEQARAQTDVDHRADLWALGVVLFEMLTGVRPFQGDANQVFAGIQNAEIPVVSKYVRRVDEGLVQIVAGCLKRERAERYGSASEVAKLLNALVAGEAALGRMAGPAAMPPPPLDATTVLPVGDATMALARGQAPASGAGGEAAYQGSVPSFHAAATVTAVLPDAVTEIRVRGGTIKMPKTRAPAEPSPPAQGASPQADPPDAGAAGRTSTEPLERSTGGAADSGIVASRSQVFDPSRRGKKAALAAAGGIFLGLGLGVAAFFMTTSPDEERSGDPVSQPTARAAQETPPPAISAPATAAPPIEPAKAAKVQPEPPVAPAPESPSTPGVMAVAPPVPEAPQAEPGGPPPPLSGRLPEKDPCADKTGFLLKNCRISESRKRASEAYDDEPEESDPYR